MKTEEKENLSRPTEPGLHLEKKKEIMVKGAGTLPVSIKEVTLREKNSYFC